LIFITFELLKQIPMTHFSWLVDGSIVGLYLLAMMIAGIMVRKYVGEVELPALSGTQPLLSISLPKERWISKECCGSFNPGVLKFRTTKNRMT
jgi:hypothetical protein